MLNFQRPLFEHVLSCDAPAQRRAIAKAITLLESTRADHRAQADELLTALLPHTGKAFRLGISGVPGVGKSTFIEVLGLYLIAQGHRVAVLTIDPSSTVSGGSILGDKTRMDRLSVHERAYIRPSPSSGTLGGVAEKERERTCVVVYQSASAVFWAGAMDRRPHQQRDGLAYVRRFVPRFAVPDLRPQRHAGLEPYGECA